MKKIYKKITALPIAALFLSACASEAVPAMQTQYSGTMLTTTVPPVPAESISVTTAVTSLDTSLTEIITTAETTVSLSQTTEQPAFQPDRERFSARLTEIYEEYGIIGMSVAVFDDGEIIHTENLGYADREQKIPCNDNTRYRIASISKVISTIGVMKMADNGDISLDTKLAEATGIEYDWVYSSGTVELKHLLTHTAGLIDTWRFENEPNMKYDINRLMANSRSGEEPGTVFNYSNFGSGSIGAVIERLSGEYFHDYMDRVLFTPLGMDAGYVIDLIDDKESVANLYDYDGEILNPREWGRDSEYYESFGLGNSYYAAQCELIITASDLAQFGIALSGDGTADGKTILSPESAAAMNENYISTEKFDMGLNVRIYDDIVVGRTIYGHPGNALGCINGIFYDPTDRTGVVFLTNRCFPATDENGFYSVLYEVVNESYSCFFQ